MKQLILTLLAMAMILAVFGSSAGAFTQMEKVVVANELLALARVPAGGFSAQERVDEVNARLAYIIGFEPLQPGSIYARAVGQNRVIMVGNTPLITITPRDAEANNSTVVGLTRMWLENARQLIPQARPPAVLA